MAGIYDDNEQVTPPWKKDTSKIGAPGTNTGVVGPDDGPNKGQTPAAPAGPSGIDPKLWDIYQKSGVTPAGRGTGFADWQYWQDVGPSQYDRLASDLAGTGSDQPTGTPGTGVWSNSGRSAAPQPTAPTQPSPTSYNFNIAPPSISPEDQAMRSQLFAQLMQRAKQGLDVSPNDPIIKSQTDAYSAQTDRANRQYLSSLAERAGSNANIGAETRLASERGGQAVGGLQAQLMGQELSARRQEIQDALNSEQGILSTDQQLALQEKLALIDDATRRLGISSQTNIAQGQLGLGYSQLGSNNDQFLAQLGLDTQKQKDYMDALHSGLLT